MKYLQSMRETIAIQWGFKGPMFVAVTAQIIGLFFDSAGFMVNTRWQNGCPKSLMTLLLELTDISCSFREVRVHYFATVTSLATAYIRYLNLEQVRGDKVAVERVGK
jgi:hypothetical protein